MYFLIVGQKSAYLILSYIGVIIDITRVDCRHCVIQGFESLADRYHT